MASPVEIPPVEVIRHPGADPCWEHIGRLALALQEFGEPEGMHRVGTFKDLGEEAPALLAGLGEAHTSLSESVEDTEVARALLMAMILSKPPGAVQVSVFDSGLTRAFADFSTLGPKLFKQVDAGGLRGLINDLSNHVTRLANEHSAPGTLTEPWKVAVLVGEGGELGAKEREQLTKLIAGGADWGSIIALGVPLEPDVWLRQGWPGNLRVESDPPIPSPVISERCKRIAEEAEQGTKPPHLSVVVPSERWTGSAVHELRAIPGLLTNGKPFHISLGDNTPHMLITGRSGGGKTVLVNAIVTSLTQTYGPDELQLMMIDFKDGTGLTSLIPNPRDPAYLPHLALVGTNVNSDHEFGINTLRYLQDEIGRRNAAAKKVGAGDYPGLRENDPGGNYPRMVAVIDEFQVLLEGPHKDQAVDLLTDLGRRARSAGIHLVLATQAVEGLTSLYTKSGALFKNFPLRIALPNGTLLNQFNNDIAQGLPRFHAVINTDAGSPGANNVIRVAAAVPAEIRRYVREAHQLSPVATNPPRVFDADIVPDLHTAKEFRTLRPRDFKSPRVLLAEETTVSGGSAGFSLTRQPGRNLAVIGQRKTEAARIIHAAAHSLARQKLPETATFSFVLADPNDQEAGDVIDKITGELRGQGHQVQVVHPKGAAAFLGQTSKGLTADTEQAHYVFVFGADASGPHMTTPEVALFDPGERIVKVMNGGPVNKGQTIAANKDGSNPIVSPTAGKAEIREGGQIAVVQPGTAGRDHLRTIMDKGPECGTHVLGTWSTVARLKEGISASSIPRYDMVGAVVAAGVPHNELTAFTGETPIVSRDGGSESRENRVRYADRFGERSSGKPRIVIPYGIPEEEED